MEAHEIRGRTNYCEQCLTWLDVDEIALCDTCANDMKASAQPEGQAAPAARADHEHSADEKMVEAASRLGGISKSALASAATDETLRKQMGAAGYDDPNKFVTYEVMRDEILNLMPGRSAKKRGQLMNDVFERHDNAGRGLPSNEQLTDPTINLLAVVYTAICEQDDMTDEVAYYPWIVDHAVIHSIKLPASGVASIDKREFEDALSDLALLGLIEIAPDKRAVRLMSGVAMADWESDSLRRGQNLDTLYGIRYRVQDRVRELRNEPKRKPKDPTPWVYNGASEEALLAVEAMSSRGVILQMGVMEGGMRAYSIREIAGHRPFEVIFDVTGNRVVSEELDDIDWTKLKEPESFTMVKDLLAALVTKLERASEAWLCRGCGELDPDGMEDGTDWHVVITQGHDEPETHSYDGECRTCPVPVPEQCGPIVKVGGRS